MYITKTYKGKKIYYMDSRNYNNAFAVLSSSSKLAPLSSLSYDIDKSKYREVARVNCSLFDYNTKRALGWEYSDLFKTTSSNEYKEVIHFKDGTYMFGDVSPRSVNLNNIKWAYSGSHVVLQDGKDVCLCPSWRTQYTTGAYCWSFFATRGDGSFVIGAVDANHTITTDELREFLKALNCTNAMINDGGGSAEFIYDGKVINRAKSNERSIANGLFVYEEIKSSSSSTTSTSTHDHTNCLNEINQLKKENERLQTIINEVKDLVD